MIAKVEDALQLPTFQLLQQIEIALGGERVQA